MIDTASLRSRLIPGDDRTAYRDPAVIVRGGLFRLYMTLVETEDDGGVYMYLAQSRSSDLIHWTKPVKFTPRDRSRNYSSPGNIVEWQGKYVMCFQSYCRENGEKYGNANCRIWFSESRDLDRWSTPRVVPLKGDTPIADLGRMIDPYLIYDGQSALWYCLFKQNGISFSSSPDLERWTFRGSMAGGENCSIVPADGGWYLFHSPQNGIGVRFSRSLDPDSAVWEDCGEPLTFGQAEWPWARGRLTAGTVIRCDDLWLMFFHGSGPEDESVNFDNNASIGLAWSRDLRHWEWR